MYEEEEETKYDREIHAWDRPSEWELGWKVPTFKNQQLP